MQKIENTTELDAVNEMLAAIGEDPIENIESLPPSGNTAHLILRSVNQDVQAEGHWFNFEKDIIYHPNSDGEIKLPINVLGATGTEADLIKRGNRLYNRDEKTFKFSSSVSCNTIYLLPWDELPTSARRYITALAIEKFMDSVPAEIGVSEARKRGFVRAKAAFDYDELSNGKYNLLNNESISQLTRRS